MVNQQEITTDKDGYLKQLSDWNMEVADAIARQENLLLAAEHWEIIEQLRDFYQRYEVSPPMRVLVKYVAQNLGKEKGRSIYLTQLFPPSPARIACKIAGLPRPANCL